MDNTDPISEYPAAVQAKELFRQGVALLQQDEPDAAVSLSFMLLYIVIFGADVVEGTSDEGTGPQPQATTANPIAQPNPLRLKRCREEQLPNLQAPPNRKAARNPLHKVKTTNKVAPASDIIPEASALPARTKGSGLDSIAAASAHAKKEKVYSWIDELSDTDLD